MPTASIHKYISSDKATAVTRFYVVLYILPSAMIAQAVFQTDIAVFIIQTLPPHNQ
jgi:hypothetical protein